MLDALIGGPELALQVRGIAAPTPRKILAMPVSR